MAYMPKRGLEEVSISNGVTPTLVEELWVDLAAPDPGTLVGDGTLRYINVTGDAMAGPLSVLPPTRVDEATNKAYVDEIVTVSTEDPVTPPARDGLLWVKVEP